MTRQEKLIHEIESQADMFSPTSVLEEKISLEPIVFDEKDTAKIKEKIMVAISVVIKIFFFILLRKLICFIKLYSSMLTLK